MLGSNVWRKVLGVDRATVIESVEIDEDGCSVVAHVRRRRPTKLRCGRCGVRSPGYDQGEGPRRWRTLDLGTVICHLEADAPRVRCPTHAVTVAQVPWARHGAGHTYAFDDQVAWLVTHTSKSAVGDLMRIAWRTVGTIVERVVADGMAARDPFEGLERIGIDEMSYKRHHHYITAVVDHGSGRLVWAAVGKDRKTMESFFDALGPERSGKIRLVSADGAAYIGDVVAARCENATLCIDPFHVAKWASDALDEVRRQVWNEARRAGMTAQAKELKGARFALWKRADALTTRQQRKLARIAQMNGPLYRAYLLKEQLRVIVGQKGGSATIELLDEWLAWACRCRIPAFVELGRKVRRHYDGICAAILKQLSNALLESTNTKLRVLHRMAFGFAVPEHLIALAMLDRGGYCPSLPGRA